MVITATELRRNINKYIDLAHKENIIITKYGKEMVVLTSLKRKAFDYLDGLLKDFDYTDLDDIKWERLKRV